MATIIIDKNEQRTVIGKLRAFAQRVNGDWEFTHERTRKSKTNPVEVNVYALVHKGVPMVTVNTALAQAFWDKGALAVLRTQR